MGANVIKGWCGTVDLVFIDAIVNPLEVMINFLKSNNSKPNINILVLDVFNVIAPEDVIEIIDTVSNYSLRLEIFKPLEPEDIIFYILNLKLTKLQENTILFVSDSPEVIPSTELNYDIVFVASILRDIEEEKRIKIVMFHYVENEAQVEKILDLFKLIPIVSSYHKFRKE